MALTGPLEVQGFVIVDGSSQQPIPVAVYVPLGAADGSTACAAVHPMSAPQTDLPFGASTHAVTRAGAAFPSHAVAVKVAVTARTPPASIDTRGAVSVKVQVKISIFGEAIARTGVTLPAMVSAAASTAAAEER